MMVVKSLRLFVACFIVASAVLLLACTPPEAAPEEDRPGNVEATILGWIAGSSAQLRADAIAEALRIEYPDWRVHSLAPGGQSQKEEKRVKGEWDYFLTALPRPLEVEVNTPLYTNVDYAQATNYNVVMPTSSHYVHFLAMGKTGLASIGDIVSGQYPFKAGTGVASGTYLFNKIMEYYGATAEEAEGWGGEYERIFIGTPTGVEALQSGMIDIGFGWSGVPNPPYMGITFDVQLLPIDEPGLVGVFEELGFFESVIPAGSYPFVAEDTPTMAYTEFLAVRTDMPDDVVYYALKAIFENKHILIGSYAAFEEQLNPEAIAVSLALADKSGVPFHPGALRFYREQGWVD